MKRLIQGLSCVVLVFNALPSHAGAGTIFSGGLSALSWIVGPASVATGGVVAGYSAVQGDKWGTGIGGAAVAGGIVLGLVDPAAVTYFDGNFTINYDPSRLSIRDVGWLGDWGVNDSLLAPPANGAAPPAGFVTVLQSPANGLTAVTNSISGQHQVSFEWGPSGKIASSSDPFNMYAVAFDVGPQSRIVWLGNSDSPIPGSNLFVSSGGITCATPQNPAARVKCGEEQTSYYRVEDVPGPLPILGVFAGLRYARKIRNRIKKLA